MLRKAVVWSGVVDINCKCMQKEIPDIIHFATEIKTWHSHNGTEPCIISKQNVFHVNVMVNNMAWQILSQKLKYIYYNWMQHGTVCNYIWGQTHNKYIEKISVLQRRDIRSIAGVNRRTNTDIYYENFQILDVKQINMYVICLFMYRFHHNLLPEVFDHYFTLNRNVHALHERPPPPPSVPLTWQREVWNIGESKFGINF